MGKWRNQLRQGLIAMLTLAVAGGGTASAVSWMPSDGISAEKDSLVRVSLAEIEDAVQGETAISQERLEAVSYASDGKSLKSTDSAIYNALKTCIEEVAEGKETSTEFALQTKLSQSKLAQVDVNTIVSYLLNDCPFDLYWHDKTKTLENGKETDGVYCKYYDDGKIVFSFKVSASYRNTPDDFYTVNTAYLNTVKAAEQKAQSIVDTNQGCTDYDKLLNYRNAICDLVYYDSAAVSGPEYGNSYQVISVFDDDMYSNVVCEGYAKAFKYLCDLSSFDNDVECYTVSGVTDAGAGAGEHMWNVVTIGGSGGESYLVDVTNCDSGTIGEGTQLFMTDNLSGSVDSGYTYSNGWSSITYQYNAESREVYGSQILSLANASHDKEAQLHIKSETPSKTEVTEDQEVTRIIKAKEPEEENTEQGTEEEAAGIPAAQSDESTPGADTPVTTEQSSHDFTFGEEKTVDVFYGDDSFVKTIVGSGGSQKVTYTSSDTTVATVTKRGKVSIQGSGTTVITAEGTGGVKDSYTLNVSPKKLTWDTSGLYAVDRVDRIGEDKSASLYGEIRLEGILPGDKDKDSRYSFESDTLNGIYADVIPGRQAVILQWKEGKEVRLTKNSKYEMPDGLPELEGQITSITRLHDPELFEPEDSSETAEGLEYKLEMEDGISEVPEPLTDDNELNTPPKIVEKLKEELNGYAGISEENIAVYDVTLSWLDKASGDEDDEGDWSKITDETFPEGGLTVTLPYPGGMPRNVDDIVVCHMFAEDMYTSSPGEVEYPSDIEETVDGIKFTVSGLSPIAIGWSAEAASEEPPEQPTPTPTGTENNNQNADNNQNSNSQNVQNPQTTTGQQTNQNTQTNRTNTNRSPVTGDTMQILIYAILLFLCIATMKGILAIRRGNKKR